MKCISLVTVFGATRLILSTSYCHHSNDRTGLLVVVFPFFVCLGGGGGGGGGREGERTSGGAQIYLK